jgi:hypothetical protein
MTPILTARSKFQIQTVASYRLERGQSRMTRDLEAYLFVPKALAVNAQTYPKYLFYRDLQTYAELLPTLRPLSHLVSPGNGLLPRLDACLSRSIGGDDERALRDVETHLRAFCRILKSSLDAHIQYIQRKGESTVAKRALEQYLDIICRVLDGFRDLGDALVKQCPQPELGTVFLLGDEYLSLTVEDAACRLAELLQRAKPDWGEELGARLHQLALSELNYREARGYRSVPARKGRNEHLVYRRGALRTYVESVFFLSTRHKPESRLARELLLSLAAGFAMVFATAVAFLAHVQFENWTTAFFLVLVISYMFKDRIKALTQDYLKTNSQRFFFDFRTTIHAQTTRHPLGVQRESMGFVQSDQIDPAVMTHRNRDRLAALDNDYCGEQIIRYKRRTTLRPERIATAFQECGIDGVNEIIHFDFTRFARKMESSRSTVFVPVENGFRKERGRYVYHLHLIIKYPSDAGPIYRHFQIVMTRGGIRRIDAIPAPEAS